MGWSFRRSKKFGPFRLNLSKRGIGASVGVRGFRLGVRPGGRITSTLSVPGTGIRHEQTIGGGGGSYGSGGVSSAPPGCTTGCLVFVLGGAAVGGLDAAGVSLGWALTGAAALALGVAIGRRVWRRRLEAPDDAPASDMLPRALVVASYVLFGVAAIFTGAMGISGGAAVFAGGALVVGVPGVGTA